MSKAPPDARLVVAVKCARRMAWRLAQMKDSKELPKLRAQQAILMDFYLKAREKGWTGTLEEWARYVGEVIEKTKENPQKEQEGGSDVHPKGTD